MGSRTMGLLVMSSVLNAALSFFVLAFALFATSPAMDDVTMRIGFYVLNAVALAAAAAVFVPWIYVHKQSNRRALFFALLPLLPHGPRHARLPDAGQLAEQDILQLEQV